MLAIQSWLPVLQTLKASFKCVPSLIHSSLCQYLISLTSEKNVIGYLPNSARTAWLLACQLILSTNFFFFFFTFSKFVINAVFVKSSVFSWLFNNLIFDSYESVVSMSFSVGRSIFSKPFWYNWLNYPLQMSWLYQQNLQILVYYQNTLYYSNLKYLMSRDALFIRSQTAYLILPDLCIVTPKTCDTSKIGVRLPC